MSRHLAMVSALALLGCGAPEKDSAPSSDTDVSSSSSTSTIITTQTTTGGTTTPTTDPSAVDSGATNASPEDTGRSDTAIRTLPGPGLDTATSTTEDTGFSDTGGSS